MKLNKYIAMGLLACLPFSSCSYLDKEPDTEITIDMVFENKRNVESWLANIYDGIPNPSRGWLVGESWEIFADDLTPSYRWYQWEFSDLTKMVNGGTWTPNTKWGGNLWQRMPQKIREAYIFIERVHALPSDDLSEEEVNYMKAEARFLAAYYWWQLAETYGPIPFKPDYIAPTDFDLTELMVGQRPFDEVVNYCDQEMLAAAQQLPPVWQTNEKYGRITSVMALTIRAKMLLFAASPLVNGNEWYASHKNREGENLFSTTYDPNKWVRAAEACKMLIDEAEGAGYELFKVYNDDGTIDPFLSATEVWFTSFQDGNREILFPYTKNNNDGNFEFYSTKVITKEFGGGGGLGVYQGLVDAFFMKNGLPIDDPNSGYVEEGFSTEKETRNTAWKYGTGVEGEITDTHTYNMYCNREPRFYTTVSYNGSWYDLAGRKYDFLNGGKDNDYTHDAPQNGYLVRKKVHPEDNKRDGNFPWRQAFLYRLASVYLDYAEALNEAYDDNTHRREALEYVNRIRERAGVRQYTTDGVSVSDENYIHVDDTKEAVRKVIRMERRVELCCEGSRWMDIRRWRTVAQGDNPYDPNDYLPEMCGEDYGMDYSARTEEDFYKRTVYQTRTWRQCYYWMPVYIDEINKNPNLVQAPFWN